MARLSDDDAPDAEFARQRWPAPRAQKFNPFYSRFVGIAKYALLLVAAGLVALVVVWPQFGDENEGFRLGMSTITAKATDDQEMLNAVFTGTDRWDRPFTVTAEAAMQSQKNENLVELELPKADITLQDESWIAVTANAGTFHKKTQMLDLKGGVIMFHDMGYEFRTPRASIDMGNRSARGDSPVQGQGPFGQISAAGFRLFENGERIIFTGKARLVFFPDAPKPTQGKKN